MVSSQPVSQSASRPISRRRLNATISGAARRSLFHSFCATIRTYSSFDLQKCTPISHYGSEACPLLKSDLSSLDFVVNRLFMKLFKTSNADAVKCCQDHFGYGLPSVSLSKRVKKFEAKFHACNNLL